MTWPDLTWEVRSGTCKVRERGRAGKGGGQVRSEGFQRVKTREGIVGGLNRYILS